MYLAVHSGAWLICQLAVTRLCFTPISTTFFGARTQLAEQTARALALERTEGKNFGAWPPLLSEERGVRVEANPLSDRRKEGDGRGYPTRR